MNDVMTRKRTHPRLAERGHDSWEVDVYVYLHSATPGDFTVDSYLQSDPGSSNLEFYNRHHNGFWVNFLLIDEQDLGYRFPTKENEKDGVWSQLGTTCPTAADPKWEVFREDKTEVRDKGLTLRAFNPNVEPALGEFRYTLNVSLDGEPQYLPLDPGGTNHNGMTTVNIGGLGDVG